MQTFLQSPKQQVSTSSPKIPQESDALAGRRAAADTHDSTLRKRVRQACVTCHSRKVRCDFSTKGAPCTNCHDDGIGHLCKLHTRKNRRASKVSSTNTDASTSHTRPEHSLGYIGNADPSSSSSASQRPDMLNRGPQSPFGLLNQQSMTDVDVSMRRDMCPPPFQGSTRFPDEMLSDPAPLLEADFSDFAGLETIFDVPDGTSMQGPGMWDFDPSLAAPGELPIIIESPPVSWTTSPGNVHAVQPLYDDEALNSDADVLKRQGCFTLPKSATLCHLMTVYFRSGHPNLPIINEAAFWRLWPTMSDEGFQLGNFSILVLQAMCFVAANYATEDVLRRCGFSSGNAAREGFYKRAKLLWDLGCETNPVSLSQCALMLSYYSPKKDLLRRNTHWLILAVFHARMAGADRYYSAINVARGAKNISVLKRLWWGCIMRDRILPLGLRRSTQIPVIEPEVECLTEKDFEDELGHSRVHNADTQIQIFRVISLVCRLSHSLTPAMETMFRVESSEERSRVGPEMLPYRLDQVRQHVNQLQDWHNEASSIFPSPINLGDTSDTVTVIANMMFIYYNTAMLCLYHHMMLLWETRHPLSPQVPYKTPINDIVEAVDKMTERVRELVQLNLVPNTPISLSAYLCFPIILQAISAKAALGAHIEGTARRQLEIYLKAMRYQKSIYQASVFASSLVDKIIFYAIDDQMLTPAQTTTSATTASTSSSTVITPGDTSAYNATPSPAAWTTNSRSASTAHEDSTLNRGTASASSSHVRGNSSNGINDAKMNNGGSGSGNSNNKQSTPDHGYGTLKGWKELLQNKPRFYLRLALHIDWSLCTGRPPSEDHFPVQLQRPRSHTRR